MACFRTSIRSLTLNMDTLLNVIIPYDHYDLAGNPEQYDKVLYLLHGLKQNGDAWQRLSSVERYANAYGYVVIMPEVQRSFYTNMAYGPRYFDYITEELPEVLPHFFQFPQDPRRTFVGGLSMGGYGALKCALLRPDRFAGAMCFSSGFFTLQNPDMLEARFYPHAEMQGVLGLDRQAAYEDDLEAVMRDYPADKPKPLLYLACGTEDYLYQNNLRMRDALIANGFELRYEEWPGAHEWRFWDPALEKGMAYFAQ